jgi:hypothetical protein
MAATMDWTFPAGADASGVFEIGRRLALHIGRLPDATRFTYDARDMLRVTRQIESVCRGGTLWVGFQSATKLDAERERYRDLLAAGTRITAFGTGAVPEGLEGLDYREQAPDTRRLANQWFLVSDDPVVAFVSWELGAPATFGVGGAATPGKQFVGFVTDDPPVVTELIATLSGLRAQGPMGGEGQMGGPPSPARRAEAAAEVDLLAAVRRLDPPASAAPDGAVVVPVGRGNDDALPLAIAIASSENRPLVIVDRSAEGLFGSPYGDLRGDDADRPDPDVLFGMTLARREGRSETSAALGVAETLGVHAGGWFPTAAGEAGLGEAIRRFGGAVLVVPATVRRPSFAERLRGMTTDRLAGLGVAVVVAD